MKSGPEEKRFRLHGVPCAPLVCSHWKFACCLYFSAPMDPPAFVDFSFQTGEVSRPLSAFVRVENSFRLSFSVEARADSGGNWLNAALSSAGTGNSFNVVVDPSLLAPGTYTGTVLVTSTEGGSTLELPVKVTIWSSATIPLTLKVGDSQTETGATIAIR